ncbi:MAG: terminase small subunit [Phycisphaerales bacterium]|nr:terminase small subunit [Phycisphaerales bacterium]
MATKKKPASEKKAKKPAPFQWSARRRAFVDEYCVDKNAAEAARRAGFAPKWADREASRLLQMPEIKEAVDAKLARLSKKTEITAEWVLKRLVENDQKAFEAGDLNASTRALEAIAKHLGMNMLKVEHTGKDGEAIQVGMMSPLELARRVAYLVHETQKAVKSGTS